MGGQPAPHRRRRVVFVTLGALAGLVTAYLALIVVPHQIAETRKRTCVDNISQLAKAMRLYTLDYNECLFFDHGDAFSPPLAAGQAGQTQYLKEAMSKYVKGDNIWYCPADPFAKKDFSCDPGWSGSFTYRKAGIGYAAIPQSKAQDPGIRALHRRLIRDYARDMRVDHAFSSYRLLPSWPGEQRPVYIDSVLRLTEWDGDDPLAREVPLPHRFYGYAEINPSLAPLFFEDVQVHHMRIPKDGALGTSRVYGKVWAYRDGHAVFHTHPFMGGGWSEEYPPD
jgi:hypothetical protein